MGAASSAHLRSRARRGGKKARNVVGAPEGDGLIVAFGKRVCHFPGPPTNGNIIRLGRRPTPADLPNADRPINNSGWRKHEAVSSPPCSCPAARRLSEAKIGMEVWSVPK